MQNTAEICDEAEIQWLQENANQLVHYKDKIGVCNVICFCQCNKHTSIAVLLVKPREKQSASCHQPMYVLPGGKRDLKSYQQSEPCWETVSREFQEEVDDNLNYFCKKKCRFFEETVQVNLDINMILDPQIKQTLQQGISRNTLKQSINTLNTQYTKNIQQTNLTNTTEQPHLDGKDDHNLLNQDVAQDMCQSLDCQPLSNSNKQTLNQQSVDSSLGIQLQQDTSEQDRYIPITRRIRSYFIEINCQDLPDIKFGRFHLFEVTERRWFELDYIIDQFKEQYQLDKKQMIISPKIFRSMSIFGGKLINIQQKQLQKLKFIYQPDICKININQDSDSGDTVDIQVEDRMHLFIQQQIQKINKTHALFTRINFSIKQQPLIQQIGSSVAFI